MPEMILREAVAMAIREAMRADENVFMMGEDIGEYGGPYAVSRGMLEEFGEDRIRDTPIAEAAIVGAGTGAALLGLKPIVEIMTINFTLVAIDQIVNHSAKLRYMSNGQLTVPLIIRTVTGGGGQLAATHSQSFENWYASVPGLKVVVPSTPYDAVGLFRTAIKDPNPIIFAEHSLLYGVRGNVPEEYYEIPFGKADLRREGEDVTIIAYSRMSHIAEQAAAMLQQRKGRTADVIDLRTLNPLDMETILASVRKTNRAVVVEETWQTGGFAAEVAARIQQEAFDDLDGPVARVNGFDVPSPYAAVLEHAVIPSPERVLKAIEENFGI